MGEFKNHDKTVPVASITKFRMPLEEGRSVPDVIVNPTYEKFLAVLSGEE